MKRGMLVLFVATLMFAEVGPLSACGDKFLGAGRGPRFSKVYAAVYPDVWCSTPRPRVTSPE